ncbi:hypothetical protein [Leptospira licerasiae]|uniref:hypothetical protein n=1 Tax=Leptospira licerasiae TaxID=447106 RepID=UPI0010827CEC|nr:hypothetical protein [Leptospira licerasiae]TGM88242.1 hypothetical protein EHR05_14530 [Leptospira licerasiae]
MKIIIIISSLILYPVLVRAESNLELLNVADKRLIGYYSIGSAYKLGSYLGLSSINRSAKGQIKNSEKALFFKYTEYNDDRYPDVYKIDFENSENENEYFGILNKQKIFKVLFVSQYSSYSKKNEIFIKFYRLDQKVDPKNLGQLQMRGDKIEKTYFVKFVNSLKDAEMEERLGACFESPIESREWPNCKPPGYNNIK